MNWQKIGGLTKEFFKGHLCATKSVQPFKNYAHLKVKKGKKLLSRKKAGSHHSKVPPETLQIAELDNGGSNWAKVSLHPLFIDLRSTDICDCVDKRHKFLGGKISIS